VLTEVSESDAAGNGAGVVLFIDELHTVVQRSLQRRCRLAILKRCWPRRLRLHRGPPIRRLPAASVGRTPPHRRSKQVVIREPSREVVVGSCAASKNAMSCTTAVNHAPTGAPLVAAIRLADR